MSREKTAEYITFGLRLKGAEMYRYQKVLEIGKARNIYAKNSDINRELLGLVPLNALTEADVEYFRTGKKLKK